MCCGNKRTQFQTQPAPLNVQGRPVGRPIQYAAPPTKLVFEYNGVRPIVVAGPVSGNRYRFGGPGARVEVDPSDRRSLAVTPKLRQVV